MQLKDYQQSWSKKPVLRAIYNDLYKKIEKYVVDGAVLEVGGGIGNLKIDKDRVVKSDIQYYHGVDVVADAQKLPFNDESFSNIILFDVLHHLQCPLLFFAEARRILKPGGRVIMMEPGITPISKFLYRVGHEELVDMKWNMNDPCKVDVDKNPYESNQAIPTILFKREPKLFLKLIKGFKILSSDWLSLFAYPLSGGFKSWSLLYYRWVDVILKVESWLMPLLGRLMAFRLIVVLEKDSE
jgi:SAM-dependent methyltransferase